MLQQLGMKAKGTFSLWKLPSIISCPGQTLWHPPAARQEAHGPPSLGNGGKRHKPIPNPHPRLQMCHLAEFRALFPRCQLLPARVRGFWAGCAPCPASSHSGRMDPCVLPSLPAGCSCSAQTLTYTFQRSGTGSWPPDAAEE